MVGVSDVPNLDWSALIWETQGFLGLDDDDPVPKDELKETALANGWSERDFEKALRVTDAVEAAGDPFASNPDPQLSVDAPESGNTGETDDNEHDHAQPEAEISENLTQTGARSTNSGWGDADFATPESGVWTPELLDREQWMGHVDKKPFAPWGDRDIEPRPDLGDARQKLYDIAPDSQPQ